MTGNRVATMRWEGTYPLTGQQIEELRRTGHILLRGVLSREEMAACRSFVRRYVLAKEEILVGISSAAAAAEFNLGDAPPDVADFVTSPRLGEIAARLLGVEAVRVLHFCGLFTCRDNGWIDVQDLFGSLRTKQRLHQCFYYFIRS